MHHKANAKTLFLKGLRAVQPQNIKFDTSKIKDREITLLGSGKAVVEMSKAFVKDCIRIKQSFLVSNYAEEIEGLEIFVSSHPVLSLNSIKAGEKLIEILSTLNEEDFFVYLLSGGSSALVEKPIPPITLEAFQEVNKLLLSCGASIDEINIVRKHLSLVKGGKLGQISKASGTVFVISDVIGDDLEAIGSAPLYCDSSSCTDAKKVLLRYALWKKVPECIRNVLNLCHHETPKLPNPKIEHTIVASNKIALDAIAKEAELMGYDVKLISEKIYGDVQEVAQMLLQSARESRYDKPLCLLFGGESTVEVKGSGRGGRNQELALWVLKEMNRDEKITFMSAGTDGIDGLSDAAGAVVDNSDFHTDIESYLQHNDSYHYHQKYNTLIHTGPSGTNVMDIMILIKD